MWRIKKDPFVRNEYLAERDRKSGGSIVLTTILFLIFFAIFMWLVGGGIVSYLLSG